MGTASYSPPVAKLLTYGDGREVGANIKDWSRLDVQLVHVA
jgi:hypothetical protein